MDYQTELAEARILLARCRGHIEGTAEAIERWAGSTRPQSTIEILAAIKEFSERPLTEVIVKLVARNA